MKRKVFKGRITAARCATFTALAMLDLASVEPRGFSVQRHHDSRTLGKPVGKTASADRHAIDVFDAQPGSIDGLESSPHRC